MADEQQGTQGQQQTQGTISEEQVNEIVNRALTAREKRLSATLEKLITDKLATFTPAKPEGEQATDGDKPKSQETPGEKALTQRLAQLERTLKEERELRERTEQAARDVSTRTKLRDALKAAGVKDDALEIAVGHLYDAKKAVKFTDDGQAVMTVTRSRQKNSPSEPQDFTDLDEAAKDWAKTQEAAFFLPAPAAKPRTPAGQYTQKPAPAPAAPANGGRMNQQDAVRRTIDQLERQGVDINAALLSE